LNCARLAVQYGKIIDLVLQPDEDGELEAYVEFQHAVR
jgi:hypothetical protein